MQTYLIGKAIRNTLLDLPVSETDKQWVITGAKDLNEALEYLAIPMVERDRYRLARLFYQNPQNGKTHFIHDEKTAIEDELAIADLTINAMAMDQAGDLIDPFGGQQDLEEGYLRHASPCFASFPENILSIAVNGAELSRWGFRVAHGTFGILKKMVAQEMPTQISEEQRHHALKAALTYERPSEFFRILHRCGALAMISPSINTLFEDTQSHSDKQLPEPISSLDNSEKSISGKLKKMLEQDFGY
jgi:tRNA nucleotidyltransferase (CCA-adding enzyme)